jgi:hypothetical protein
MSEGVPPPATEDGRLMPPSPAATSRSGTEGQGALLAQLQQSIDRCNKRYLFVNQKFNADLQCLQAHIDALLQRDWRKLYTQNRAEGVR